MNKNIDKFISKFDFSFDDDDIEQIKDLSTEDKTELCRAAISYDKLANKNCLFNVYLLINARYANDTNIFESKLCWINGATEYVAIKRKLKNEVDKFTKELVEIFLSCIKTFHVTTDLNDFYEAPILHEVMLNLSNLTFISSLLDKVDITQLQLKNIKFNKSIIDNIIQKQLSSNIIYNIFDQLKPDDKWMKK